MKTFLPLILIVVCTSFAAHANADATSDKMETLIKDQIDVLRTVIRDADRTSRATFELRVAKLETSIGAGFEALQAVVEKGRAAYVKKLNEKFDEAVVDLKKASAEEAQKIEGELAKLNLTIEAHIKKSQGAIMEKLVEIEKKIDALGKK